MIPEFDKNGNLPEGIHLATEEEFLDRFGSTSARRNLFDYIGAKIEFHSDVFWCKASIGEDTLAIWLDTYQTTKDFKRRGIVEVI